MIRLRRRLPSLLNSLPFRKCTPSIFYALILCVIFVSFQSFQMLSTRCNYKQPKQSLVETLENWLNPQFAIQRLRIFVYDIPPIFNTHLVQDSIRNPSRIRDPRCDTNFYSSEVHIHQYLLKSHIRTKHPDKADFFYVPIYATCDLIQHQPNNVERVGEHFETAMNWISERYPFWNQSNGRDHVYVFAQGFAARLAGNWPKYSNGIFMVHNGEFTASEYTPHKDITIPPELRGYLQPYWVTRYGTKSDFSKEYLAHFGGQVVNQSIEDHRGRNFSGGVRQYIVSKFTNNEDYRITGVRSQSYLNDMMKSRFCLAPEGWHPWSPRPYYAVLMGCIPVIISEVQELAFEDLIDWGSFAVWVRPQHITHLDTILRSFSEDEIQTRRDNMRKVWRALWYGDNGLANEAIMQELFQRRYQIRPKRLFSTLNR